MARSARNNALSVRALGFDLQTLEIFLAVCRTGGMTAAARQTGLTQSAVSRQILSLEQRLGVWLFERDARPLKPTPAGQKLMRSAERLIAEAVALRAQMQSAMAGLIPQVRLGLIDSLSDPLVPLLIKSLRDRVEAVSVTTGFVAPLRERMLRRDLDAVISSDAFDDLDGFERFDLFRETFIVVAPKGLPPFGDEGEFRRFASTFPMIRSGASTGIAQRVEQHFRRLRLEVPHTFSCDTMESVLSLVASGLGWSVLTPVCLRKGISYMPEVQALPMPGAQFSRDIHLVVRRGEFDGFARQLAGACRRAIQKTYAPRLSAVAPWLGEAITVAKS